MARVTRLSVVENNDVTTFADNERPSSQAIDAHVGLRVRARRRALGLGQVHLAQRLGLTFQQVQKYERGSNRISASKLYEIAKALQVPVAFFFEGLETPPAASEPEALVHNFLHSTGALDLGEAYLRLVNDDQRRIVLDLMKSMAPTQVG